jgi:transcriptional regulator with XRE-family HTH domain
MAVKIGIESIATVGRIVQFHRKRAGLSRIALADIASVGKTVVYDIEKGKQTVRFNSLLKILDALNISLIMDGPLMDRYGESDSAKS